MTPPLGIYVHWPYCARVCPYCDFVVKRDRTDGREPARLGEALLRDLETQSRPLAGRPLVSVFFGGGTPSLMPPDLVAAVLALCRARFAASADLEVSLEANPTDADRDRFEALREAGVQRLSLGVQSFREETLVFLGRNHGGAEALRAAALAARVFPRLSLDLIFAVPGQTEADFEAELATALSFGPEHLSLYELTIEPGTAFDRAVRRGRFTPADADRAARLFELKEARLAEAGFTAYEISNHARGAAAECRHNRLYWSGGDYLGIGPGAHGRITLEGTRRATRAHSQVGAYVAGVDAAGSGLAESAALTALERAEERLIMGLRTREGVDRRELAPLALGALPDLVADGHIAADGSRIRATPGGRLVLNRLVELLADGG